MGWILLGVLAAGTPAVAQGRGKDGNGGDALRAAIDAVEDAIQKGDASALGEAAAKLQEVRGTADAGKLAPVAKALGKGAGHKDQAVALQAIEALGALKLEDTAKALGRLLAPPAKVKEDKVALHEAAIRAAGQSGDADALKPLEKLLGHAMPSMAVAAAEALGQFKDLDKKPKHALLKRLVGALEKLEKKAESAKDEEKEGAARVVTAVNAALGALTGVTHATSDEWDAYVKEQAKT